MNDRFSAQLRQHLLDTANERPAEGQFAAFAERLAVTAQRRPLAARLTWNPDRVGAFPSGAVKWGLVAVALALATVAAVVLIGNAPRPPSTVFEGTWTSVDPADGSSQSLVVGEGTTPDVHFVDHFATGAACLRDAVKVYTADGRGTISGSRLSVRWPAGGGCGLDTVAMDDETYTFNEATDTMVDGQQLTWRRAVGAVAPPTRGPVAEATPAPGQGMCFGLPHGGTYRNTVGSLALTVTVPASAAFTWQGYREAFSVSEFCWSGGPVGIKASIIETVDGDCNASTGRAVTTPAEVVAAVADAPGFTISQRTNVTLAGYQATRFVVAPDGPMCFDEVRLWNDDTFLRGTTAILYVVDVRGLALGIRIHDRNAEESVGQVAEAEEILASLRIDAVTGLHPTSEPAVTPDPECTQFDGTGTYAAPVGRLSVGVTLPNEPGTYWHGVRDEFYLNRAPCLFDGPVSFQASIVTQVPPDACHWLDAGTPVADAAAAAAALAGQAGPDASKPTKLKVSGHTAARVRISLSDGFNMDACASGLVGLWSRPDGSTQTIDPGATMTVYLVDVQGSVLAITERHEPSDETAIPGLLGEIDAIIGSLQIKA